MTGIFSILAVPLGWIMRLLYGVISNYGWTIILFTIITRVLLFPLSLRQQKSTARMSAYQPMITEIQKKWANDRERQNEEMQKFYEENDIKMTAGCMPMLINMLVLFGIIAVIQAPLTYIMDVPQDQIENGVAIVQKLHEEDDSTTTAYTQQSILIGEIKENKEYFLNPKEMDGVKGAKDLKAMDKDAVEKVYNFNFDFMGLDLAVVPSMAMNRYLILPILSVLTMFLSQYIVMKSTPSAAGQGKSMWIMTLVMGAMFGYFAFTVPVGFSLYYTISNILMTGQQLIVRKIHNPEDIRQEIIDAMEQKKIDSKKKKKVVVQDAKGEAVTKSVTEAELERIRLDMARQLDDDKYGNLDDEIEKQQNDAAAKEGEDGAKGTKSDDTKDQ